MSVEQPVQFNGKEYPSISSMPKEVRKAYEKLEKIFEDRDNNGVPDIFEKDQEKTNPSMKVSKASLETSGPSVLPPEHTQPQSVSLTPPLASMGLVIWLGGLLALLIFG